MRKYHLKALISNLHIGLLLSSHAPLKKHNLHGAPSSPVHSISRCVWFNGNCTRTFEAGAHSGIQQQGLSDWLTAYIFLHTKPRNNRENQSPSSTKLPTELEILLIGLVSFVFVSLLNQGKLAQSKD